MPLHRLTLSLSRSFSPQTDSLPKCCQAEFVAEILKQKFIYLLRTPVGAMFVVIYLVLVYCFSGC